MNRPWLPLAGLLCLAVAPPLGRADNKPLPAVTPEVLAKRIDELIAAPWRERGVTATPLADDAEFLRRVFLDLGGRIPRVQEVREFLDDASSDKRRKVVDKLLESPYYVNHFTNVWRALMLPQTNNALGPPLAPQLEAWLKKRVRENAPYDRLVREVLTVSVRRQAMMSAGEPSPAVFYQANENKPENLASATSRLFLGVKLECAQCHNHPFAKWTKQQFWEYAAFFQPTAEREARVPGTEKTVQARFLDGSEPKKKSADSARETLADWVTSSENPYFARAAANRLWAHFFGLGLVEPIDEESDDNKPSHPELLDELSRQLALHSFDLRYLMKAIAYSNTYQLSSNSETTPLDAHLFARMSLKGLSPEQLYDSIAQATGFREPPTPDQRFMPFAPAGPRAEFLTRFANLSDKRTEYQTSILQALALMNGRFVADATSLERSETLAAVVDAPFLDSAGRVEALYLAALGRRPRADEKERLVKYVERGGPSGDAKKALADVFWALLNTSEFVLNH